MRLLSVFIVALALCGIASFGVALTVLFVRLMMLVHGG
jgi:hypothetical protein